MNQALLLGALALGLAAVPAPAAEPVTVGYQLIYA